MQSQWLTKIVLSSLFIIFLSMAPMVTYGEVTRVSKEEITHDLKELYQRLQKAHYDLYAHRSKADFDKHFKKLSNSITGSMTLSEATIFFQQLASFANIAHTKIDLPVEDYREFRQSGGKTFPIFIKVIDGKVYVAENYSDQTGIKAGDEVVSLNQKSMEEVLKALRKYKSADTDTMFYGFLEFELPMLLWFEYGRPEFYEIEIKGKTDTKTFKVATSSYETLIKKMELQKGLLELNFERIAKINKNIGYLRPGPFFNTEPGTKDVWANTSFKDFIDDSFKRFIEQDVDALLIDLRVNPGGDNSFSDYLINQFADQDFKFASSFKVKVSSEFIEANEKRLKNRSDGGISFQYQKAYQGLQLGEKFDFELPIYKVSKPVFKKPVYVLVNRHSYSNAVTTAAMIQDYGFGIILGEETNDLATTYGAMESFNLTKSGITVSFPKAHIIRPNGNPKAQGVIPDIRIKTPLVEYEEDCVLQQAFKVIETKFKNDELSRN